MKVWNLLNSKFQVPKFHVCFLPYKKGWLDFFFDSGGKCQKKKVQGKSTEAVKKNKNNVPGMGDGSKGVLC